MKKMMMIAAVAFAACMVNASSITWNTSNVSALSTLAGTGTYAANWQGQVVSFFYSTDAGLSSMAVKDLLAGGTSLASIDVSVKGTLDKTATLLGAATFAGSGTGTLTTFAKNDVVYGYAVVFNNDGSMFAISNIKSGTFGTANLTVAMGAATTIQQSPWGVYAVPEPTSMALLALGVAALGLRRKFRK